MRISINIPHSGPLCSPTAIRDVAQAAEELGFDGIGVLDHLALPRHVASLYDLGERPVGIPENNMRKTLSPLYECVVTMSYLAGITRRVRISSGICVLPLRNPVYNARQLATLDALSDGRIDLGIGTGWLAEEANAMQMPWERRGARTDEHIRVLRALWESESEYVSFQGEFYRFEDIDPKPQPVQRPLPILVGGHSNAAKRRAGQLGDGWITSNLAPAAQAAGMEEVRAAAREAGRDPARLQWFGSADARLERGEIKAPERLLASLRASSALGLHEVQVVCQTRSMPDRMTLLNWIATEVLPEFQVHKVRR